MKVAPALVKETKVSYKEIVDALTDLGYRNETNEERYRFVNDRYQSVVQLPPYPLNEIVRKEFVAMYSSQFFMQGVIKQEENLVKKILKMRLKKPVMA